MIDTIYYEEGIIDHPRVIALLDRSQMQPLYPVKIIRRSLIRAGRTFVFRKKIRRSFWPEKMAS